MDIEELLFRPIKLLERKKGFDKVGEAVIIDVNKLIYEDQVEIEYLVLNKVSDRFLRSSEYIRLIDAEESIELLDAFSTRWKRSMLRIVFYEKKSNDNKFTLQELTDDSNIKEYNLDKYF